MPNPTTKLASFLFKGRRLSQTYLELSSSRKCLAAGKVKERKRERRERREKIKAKLKQKQFIYKSSKRKELTNHQKTKIHHQSSSPLLQNMRGIYRPPQSMKLPKTLITKLSYRIGE